MVLRKEKVLFFTFGDPGDKSPRGVKNNKVYFDISINIKDIQVIYYIKKELGFGKVLIRDLGQDNSHSSSSDSRIVSFYITSADNFSRLVSLFNGNLCTVNKKQEFQTWLNVFNNQYSKEILFIDRIIKASLNTGWLSGYIDAMPPQVCSFTGFPNGVPVGLPWAGVNNFDYSVNNPLFVDYSTNNQNYNPWSFLIFLWEISIIKS